MSNGGRPAYEIVFECHDRQVGRQLAEHLEDVVGDATSVVVAEQGSTWTVTLEFPHADAADGFFEGDGYVRYCDRVHRGCRSSVLVVPLGSR